MIKQITNISKCNKYLSILFWKLKINRFLNGENQFDSIEILEIEIDDNSELGRMLKGDEKA